MVKQRDSHSAISFYPVWLLAVVLLASYVAVVSGFFHSPFSLLIMILFTVVEFLPSSFISVTAFSNCPFDKVIGALSFALKLSMSSFSVIDDTSGSVPKFLKSHLLNSKL